MNNKNLIAAIHKIDPEAKLEGKTNAQLTAILNNLKAVGADKMAPAGDGGKTSDTDTDTDTDTEDDSESEGEGDNTEGAEGAARAGRLRAEEEKRAQDAKDADRINRAQERLAAEAAKPPKERKLKGYAVAPGHSLTTRRGIKCAGDAIAAGDFPGNSEESQKRFDVQLERKKIIEVFE